MREGLREDTPISLDRLSGRFIVLEAQEVVTSGRSADENEARPDDKVLLVRLPKENESFPVVVLSPQALADGGGTMTEKPRQRPQGSGAAAPIPPPQGQPLSGDTNGSSSPWDALTARERGVLTLIGQGYSNKLVADALSLSPQTVKNYTHSIMQKLGAHNRDHAVMLALKHNWLQLEAL